MDHQINKHQLEDGEGKEKIDQGLYVVKSACKNGINTWPVNESFKHL